MFKFLKKIFRGNDPAEQPAAPAPAEPTTAPPEAAVVPTPADAAEPPRRLQEPAAVEPAAARSVGAAPVAHAQPAVPDESPVAAFRPVDALRSEPGIGARPDAPATMPTDVLFTEAARVEAEPAALVSAAPASVERPAGDEPVRSPLRADTPGPAPTVTPPSPVAPALAVWAAAPSLIGSALVTPLEIPVPQSAPAARERWTSRLKTGLRKTGSNLSSVFTGAQITESLYDDLESALLLADTGVPATQFLLDEVRRRVKAGGATHPTAVRNALVEALTQLLKPLERELVIGRFTPTVIMVAGVNGAGKTTSIGKLTKHLSNEGAAVLLAAADTFRAAAREQLGIWADRNLVEIVSQEGGDPAAVSFDAVTAGRARGKDVVLVDTAGRLPTQLHLMDELKKIKRVVQKADATAPHEVLLVIDGNTGQNALAQVKSFDAALGLTGLIVTKLDGTAKGGMLAAIAQWGVDRARIRPGAQPIPVYFIGVGEKLEDLETFNAREFAQALLS